jgi:hypothetical protein
MAHALAQSQLTAEDEGEAEAGEVCGTKAVLSSNSPCNRCHVLLCHVLSCPLYSSEEKLRILCLSFSPIPLSFISLMLSYLILSSPLLHLSDSHHPTTSTHNA